MTSSTFEPPESGFDIFVENGTSHIVDFDPPTGDGDDNNDASDEEDEDEILFAHTPRWDSVKLDITGGEPPLVGPYRYHLAYWVRVDSEIPDGEGGTTTEYSKSYQPLTITSQTITIVSHPWTDPGVFFSNTGNEIFPQSPGLSNASNPGGIRYQFIDPVEGEITVRYSYLLVFDEAELEWLPPASTLNQEIITKKTPPVDKPIKEFDEETNDKPVYPMDTLSALIPDPREVVNVVYRVVTEYSVAAIPGIPGASGTFTFEIHQACTQDQEITAEKMEAILNKCYYTHGFTHTQLYDVDAPPNYDEYGDPIPLKDDDGNFILDEDGNQTFNIKQPEYKINKEESELVGFTVYELKNSVWVLNDIDKVPEQEAASEISLQETVDEGQEQIKGLEDLMATTQQEYENEIASIDKIQQENADIIRVNEERKSKLLGNIKNMITGTTSDTSSTTEETEETAATNTTNTNPTPRSSGSSSTSTGGY